MWIVRFLIASVFVSIFAILAAHAAPQRVALPGYDGVTLQGWLYTPETAGRHPAVVALHGCAGLNDKSGAPSARHADWGERLSISGFIVLFPDSFGSRGLGSQCKESEREVRPSRERVADANAALRFLAARDDVDTTSISLLGWSNGGSSTLYAVEPNNAPDGVDFARAIAFYPGCRVPLEHGRWASRMPLLVLIGADDDWTPAAPCADLAAKAKAQGEKVDIVVYPHAYHDFDHPDLPAHTVDGLAFTANGSSSAHTGTNSAARADAIKRVADFLSR
ncbi:MAG TPA: dienelactone hydrolase family protein [Methylocella sp.]|jgi:dienelactone hydrolase